MPAVNTDLEATKLSVVARPLIHRVDERTTVRATRRKACRPSEVLRPAKHLRSPRTATPDAPRQLKSVAGRRLPTYVSWPRLCSSSRTGHIGREVADCPDGTPPPWIRAFAGTNARAQRFLNAADRRS